LRDIDAHLPISSHFFVHGNIRDRYLVPDGDHFRFVDLAPALSRLLGLSGYQAVITYDPVSGLGVIPGDADTRSLLAVLPNGEWWQERLGRPLTPEWLSNLIEAVQPDQPTCRFTLLIDYVSQFAPVGQPLGDELHAMYRTALHRMHHTRRSYVPEAERKSLYNPVFWIVDRPSDLPGWLVSANDGSHSVPIPAPDLDTRTRAGNQIASSSALGSFTAEERDSFVGLTDGMTLRAMQEIVQLAQDQRLRAANIADAVRMYRTGLLDNPWNQDALKAKIRTAEDVLSERVRGQSGAIHRSLDILMRSSTGLTAAHTGGRSTGPRGVLFLAGPTGVGKTELAKQLTVILFGDPESYIRFDMSEFSGTGSDQRLMGSPPGYIGHESGGELTNAVRQKPFSLILFDEIEKADQTIMDKFLQILSDGRLTDGSGATVHFKDTIIVFTSNIGMSDPLPDGELPKPETTSLAQLDEHVRWHVSRHFTKELRRPEILNRLGDNIVVFDFIRGNVAGQILALFVRNTIERVNELHGIGVTLSDRARETLWRECCSDLSMGGRGIGHRVESVFTNPLARQIFLNDDPSGSIDIDDFVCEKDGTWTLSLV
jgi:energy-coupling factor transporter ATP-binding protein EcfA2